MRENLLSPGACQGGTFQANERDMGVNTVIGYFAQHQAEELNPNNEVLAEVEGVCENNPGKSTGNT